MSYSSQALRARFTDGALSTASGPRVVVMAYDRLDRDLAGAIAALEMKDITTSHQLLVHAQDLVHELLFMLDLDVWEHASTLAAIYRQTTDPTLADERTLVFNLERTLARLSGHAGEPSAAVAGVDRVTGLPLRTN